MTPKKEPVIYASFVQALITLAVSFGLKLTGEQTAALIVVLAPIVALVVRRYVTPYLTPAKEEESNGNA